MYILHGRERGGEGRERRLGGGEGRRNGERCEKDGKEDKERDRHTYRRIDRTVKL